MRAVIENGSADRVTSTGALLLRCSCRRTRYVRMSEADLFSDQELTFPTSPGHYNFQYGPIIIVVTNVARLSEVQRVTMF